MTRLMSRQKYAKNRSAERYLRLGFALALFVCVGHSRVYADEDATPRRDDMQNLQQRVGELKEQVFRAKARLSLLSERFLRSSAGGGRAVIVHQSQMGQLYQPVRIAYQLDGREIFRKSSDSDGAPLEKTGELTVFEGDLKPGNHTLSVSVEYRGNGTRVFSYFNKYNYTANAAQRFAASDGGITRIRVVCRQQGNPALTEVADRPLIEFQVDDGGGKSPAKSGEKNSAARAPTVKAENGRGAEPAPKLEASPSVPP